LLAEETTVDAQAVTRHAEELKREADLLHAHLAPYNDQASRALEAATSHSHIVTAVEDASTATDNAKTAVRDGLEEMEGEDLEALTKVWFTVTYSNPDNILGGKNEEYESSS
jgi:hypothetical protein